MYKVDDKEAPLICFEKKIMLSIFKYEQNFYKHCQNYMC